VTLTLGFPTVGNKLISPGASLWEFPFLPIHSPCTSRSAHERKLQTQVGAAVYATRKFIVEPVFGQIKQARGFRQFLLRGLEKVRGEWALICMTHNILKFHKIICSG